MPGESETPTWVWVIVAIIVVLVVGFMWMKYYDPEEITALEADASEAETTAKADATSFENRVRSFFRPSGPAEPGSATVEKFGARSQKTWRGR